MSDGSLYGTFRGRLILPEDNHLPYMRDFSFGVGVPAGEWAVYERFGSYGLVADGYGLHPPEGAYGNGPLLIRAEHLDPLLCAARHGVWNWTGL